MRASNSLCNDFSLTGLCISDLLLASHIKPWRDSNDIERTSLYNGLLLIPSLDRAFDKGLISFENTGKILISKSLSQQDQGTLGIHEKMKLRKIEHEHFYFLQHHRQNIYIP